MTIYCWMSKAMNNEAFTKVKGTLPQKRQPKLSELPAQEVLPLTRVTPTTALTPMEPLFRMYDVPCFYRGELVAVCGKAKSGKTLFLSILMAACLTPKMLALEQSNTEKPLRVLWLDTEQSQQSTQDIIIHRIIPLVRGRTDQDALTDNQTATAFDDIFFAYNLRGMGFKKRRQLMEIAISNVQPDLVVIDGIKDLVTDINDAAQATLIMEQVMGLAQNHHCCIVNVLHQNKSEADHNMRGSIGTELTNKAFEVYTCEYLESRDTFKVSQRLSRRNRIKRRLFYQLGEDGLPIESAEKPVRDLRKLFVDAMEGRQQRPFSELMAVALKHCGVVDAKAYYDYVAEAESQGIIRKVAHPETGKTWVELAEEQLPF